MKNLKKRLSLNQSGIVLTMVMIVLLIMSIIISAVVFITVTNLNNSQKAASHTETYYVAEGGINYLTQSFETYYSTAPDTNAIQFFAAIDAYAGTFPENNKQILPFSDNKGKTSQALMWVIPLTVSDPTVHSYQLYSSGYIGNVYRTLSKTISISYVTGLTFDDAIFAVGTIDVGGAIIDGQIQTNSDDTPAITFRDGTVDAIYIPEGTDPNEVVDFDNNNITSGGSAGIHQVASPTVNPIVIPAAPSNTSKLKTKTFTVSGKSYTLVNSNGDLQITSSSNLTVPTVYNIGDENPGKDTFYVPNFKITYLAPNFTMEVNRDITIVTDTLWLNNQFKVTGTGKLTIFVKPYTSSSSTNTRIQINATGIVGNVSDSTKMSIYVGALTKKISGKNVPVLLSLSSGKYYFSLLCANLNIDLNDSTLRGAVATNALAINAVKISDTTANVFIGPSSSASAVLLYAPTAIVAMKSSAEFYGAIVAGSFISATGNSKPELYWRSEVNAYIPDDIIDLSDFTPEPSITISKTATIE
jgi:hypothetical protein